MTDIARPPPIDEPDSKRGRLLRFLLVGGLNTAFGYSIYGLLLWLGLGLALSLLGATLVGVLFNFVTTGRLVFKDARLSVLPRFVLSYGLAWAFGTVTISWAARLRPYAALANVLPSIRRSEACAAISQLNEFVAGLAMLPVNTVATYSLLVLITYRPSGAKPTRQTATNPGSDES